MSKSSRIGYAEELVGPSVKLLSRMESRRRRRMAFAKKAGVEVDALKTSSDAKGRVSGGDCGEGGAERCGGDCGGVAEGVGGDLLGEEYVLAAGEAGAVCAAGAVDGGAAGWGGGAGGVLAGMRRATVTYGHRVLFGDAAIALGSPGEYEEALLTGFVIADVEVRRQRIRKALDKVTRTVEGLRWREDHGLVDKLTHLTEWPSVLLGGFEPEYLALPEEVLVTVMRDHQSYFAVEDKDGKLAPHFLAVLNTETDEAGMAVIRHGNERVLRARFNDARFFWEFDQRVPLMERVELLENVTFQKDLGSYAAKTERVRSAGCERWRTLVRDRGLAVDAEGAG